jgi:hypothetical protein
MPKVCQPPQMDELKTPNLEDKQKWKLDLVKKAKNAVARLFTKDLGADIPLQKVTQWYINLVLGEELIEEGVWPENAKTLFEGEKQHQPKTLERMAQIFWENLNPDGQHWEIMAPESEIKSNSNENEVLIFINEKFAEWEEKFDNNSKEISTKYEIMENNFTIMEKKLLNITHMEIKPQANSELSGKIKLIKFDLEAIKEHLKSRGSSNAIGDLTKVVSQIKMDIDLFKKISPMFPMGKITKWAEKAKTLENWDAETYGEFGRSIRQYLGATTSGLVLDVENILVKGTTNFEMITKFANLMAEKIPNGRMSMEHICNMLLQDLQRMIIMLTEPGNLSLSTMIPLALRTKVLAKDCLGQNSIILQKMEDVITLLASDNPIGKDAHEIILASIPPGIIDQNTGLHSIISQNGQRDKRFTDWLYRPLPVTVNTHSYADYGIYDAPRGSDEATIFDRFRPDQRDVQEPVQKRSRQNSGKKDVY